MSSRSQIRRTLDTTVLLFGLLLALLAVGCASTPTAPPIRATVETDPPGADILLDGRRLGSAPLEVPIANFDQVLGLTARTTDATLVERRVKILGPQEVQVFLRYGDQPSELARQLGLSRVVVFDYGDRATFEVDQYDLKEDLHPLLRRQAEVLDEHFAGVDVYVCGHTDSSGEADYNQVLSVRRAQAVADFLAASGLDASRLRVQGFGPDYPLADNASREGRALNRRTEIILPD